MDGRFPATYLSRYTGVAPFCIKLAISAEQVRNKRRDCCESNYRVQVVKTILQVYWSPVYAVSYQRSGSSPLFPCLRSESLGFI
jgi:hypothetical protein